MHARAWSPESNHNRSMADDVRRCIAAHDTHLQLHFTTKARLPHSLTQRGESITGGFVPWRLNFGPIVMMCRRKKVRSCPFAQVAHYISSQSTCSRLITWQPPTTSCISPAKPSLGSPCKCPGGVGRYPGDQHSVAGSHARSLITP